MAAAVGVVGAAGTAALSLLMPGVPAAGSPVAFVVVARVAGPDAGIEPVLMPAMSQFGPQPQPLAEQLHPQVCPRQPWLKL